MTAMRFMWSLSSVGDSLRRAHSMTGISGLPNVEEHVEFCRRAELCGIDSLLMAFGFTRPDPITYSATLGARTDKIKFLVAVRSGIFSPTYFVQQINTLSAVTHGRVCINIVAGRAPDELRYYGDFLPHDERYERTDEFWSICHALWRADGPVDFAGRHYRVEGARVNTPFVSDGALKRPEIFIGGASDQARALAIRHADCLLTFPDAPDRMAPTIRPVLDSGTSVGLLVTLICKPTRAEAVEAAHELVTSAGEQARARHGVLRSRSDSVGYTTTYDLARAADWPTPYLWTGAVPYLGPPGIALVGSPDDIVDALTEYQSIGVTRFLFIGHPDFEQMTFFGNEVLPRVRERESVDARGV
jgi:alkanesulfonate monooxygenase